MIVCEDCLKVVEEMDAQNRESSKQKFLILADEMEEWVIKNTPTQSSDFIRRLIKFRQSLDEKAENLSVIRKSTVAKVNKAPTAQNHIHRRKASGDEKHARTTNKINGRPRDARAGDARAAKPAGKPKRSR